ncbi:DUF488 domain-containing protein [Streptomyces jeddahensis]|uniref:DUF488 family protein n=1 Tax=Streptomyces jeddahensis TaxID=1716141 RepID=A0A177HP57_9ACTN|nr:DUF488 family protein [Streptomyces jeddahensis]OAH11984.1 hypothetical protein STSP_47060 [Streptomyces jeddahensis]
MVRKSRKSGAVRMRRVYDPVEADDGTRVLVDRLWPRGLSKDAARLDTWLKEVAPSDELRKWYGHDPGRHEEFVERYRAELADPERTAALERLRDLAASGPVTLLSSTKELPLSHLPVIAEAMGD